MNYQNENKNVEMKSKQNLTKLDVEVNKNIKEDPGHTIFQKRHLLKKRKRERVFDAFIESHEPKRKIIKPKKPKKKPEKPRKKKVLFKHTIFERLFDFVTENKTFRNLEVLLKKKPEKIEKLSELKQKEEKKENHIMDRLDNLISKNE